MVTVLGLFVLLAAGSELFGYKQLALVSGAVDLIALVGLFFFIRSEPVLSKWFWRAILTVSIIKFIGPTIGLFRGALAFSGPEQRVALVAAIASLWGIPLIYGLWRYCFGPNLWREGAANSSFKTKPFRG